jgi:hypothetical protein
MKASIAQYSSARVDMVVSGALFAAAASILLVTYGNYFPLIEYREITQGEYGSAVGLPIAEQFTRFFPSLSARASPPAIPGEDRATLRGPRRRWALQT